jgi:hypothetical protein
VEKPLNGRGPEHGCGMKQAREPDRGANRREAERAWGRTEAGALGTSRNAGGPVRAGTGVVVREGAQAHSDRWTRTGDVMRRAETLVGECELRKGFAARGVKEL